MFRRSIVAYFNVIVMFLKVFWRVWTIWEKAWVSLSSSEINGIDHLQILFSFSRFNFFVCMAMALAVFEAETCSVTKVVRLTKVYSLTSNSIDYNHVRTASAELMRL